MGHAAANEHDLLARGGGDRGVYWSEPVVVVGLAAAGDGEKFFLQAAGDGTGYAFADLDVIDRADREIGRAHV